jgi:hypothetical protein
VYILVKVTNIERKIIKRFYGPTVDTDGLRRRTNDEINTLLRQRNIVRDTKAQRLARLGHMERMHKERTTKNITRWKLLSSRPKGRPTKKLGDVLQDLQIIKIKSWKALVRRKEQWEEILSNPRPILGCRAVTDVSCRIRANWN